MHVQTSGRTEMTSSKLEDGRDPLGTPAKVKKSNLKHSSDACQFEENMPSTILSTYNVAQARAAELKEMLNAVESIGGSKRTFQKLPRHMRRRAASYNVKRLPRRMREAAHAEMSQCGGSKAKPPSRRKRRHPESLTAEYKRRSDKETWLETHIWHAKRMKMVSKWGYKLALRDAGKGVRATYRGLRTACLVSDMSYYHCLELSGSEKDILTSMCRLTSSDTGLTCAAKGYLSGEYRGRVMLYSCDRYPFGCIGPANVMWRPEQACTPDVGTSDKNEGSLCRMMWLWVHPMISEQVESELNDARSKLPVNVRLRKDEFTFMRLFGPKALDVITTMLQDVESQGCDANAEQRQKYFSLLEKSTGNSREDIAKNIQWWRTSQASVSTLGGSSLRDLLTLHVPQGAIFGFVVRDPRGTTPSKRIAAAYDRSAGDRELGECSSSDDESLGSDGRDDRDSVSDDGSVEDDAGDFAEDIGGSESTRMDDNNDGGFGGSHIEMSTIGASQMMSKSRAPPIRQLEGLDPNAGSLSSVSAKVSSVVARPHQGAQSPHALVWDGEVRRSVTQSKVPHYIVNQARTGKLVRSKLLQVGDVECRIPLLLIPQELGTTTRTGTDAHSSSLRCWDLVCPEGWSMAVLVNGVYHAARPCGLEEVQRVCLESGTLHFPTDHPDTRAALSEARGDRAQLEEAFSRRPPAKRPNYGKLAVNSPFDLPWSSLFREEEKVQTTTSLDEGKTGQFFVLRSRQLLRALSLKFARPQSVSDASLDEFRQPHHKHALVAVELVPARKGEPERFAMLCVPTLDDIKRFKRDAKFSGPEESIVPRATCFVSQHQVHVGKSALSKQALKQAKASWKKNAKKVSNFNKCSTSTAASSSELTTAMPEQASVDPPTSEALRTGHSPTVDCPTPAPALPDVPAWFGLEPVDPSRRIVGYVTSGGYQHSRGRGFGVGFCPLTALVDLVQLAAEQGLKRPLLLLRNSKSRHYCFVDVSVH